MLGTCMRSETIRVRATEGMKQSQRTGLVDRLSVPKVDRDRAEYALIRDRLNVTLDSAFK